MSMYDFHHRGPLQTMQEQFTNSLAWTLQLGKDKNMHVCNFDLQFTSDFSKDRHN